MDYYQILDLPQNCTQKDIKQQFLKKIKNIHPDKQGTKEEASKFIEAYKILINAREEYDQSLKQQFKYCIKQIVVNNQEFTYECEQCGDENTIFLEYMNMIVECRSCNLRLEVFQY